MGSLTTSSAPVHLTFLFHYWQPVLRDLFLKHGVPHVILMEFLMNCIKWRWKIPASNKLRVICNMVPNLKIHQNPKLLWYFMLASCCRLSFVVTYYLMWVLFPMYFSKLVKSLCNRAGTHLSRRTGSAADTTPAPDSLRAAVVGGSGWEVKERK